MALMLLDLDHFKVINGSLCRDVGDRLLAHLAQTFKSCLRSGDALGRNGGDDSFTVSRLGGDEFTVIAERISSPGTPTPSSSRSAGKGRNCTCRKASASRCTRPTTPTSTA